MSRLLLALLLGLAVLPAHAGLFDDDEARAKATEANKRVDTISKNQLEFSNQLDAIRTQLAELRGKVEVQANEMEATQKRQKDFYIDLDARLRKLEPVSADTEKVDKSSVASTAEATDYESALNQLKAGKYKEAVGAFQAFIKAYPNGTLTAAAHFWAASSYYQLKDYAKAGEYFALTTKNWPNDAKAPDALFGQASAQYDAGDAKGGRKTLERLLEKYPKSSAAQNARVRLKKK